MKQRKPWLKEVVLDFVDNKLCCTIVGILPAFKKRSEQQEATLLRRAI